MKRNGSVLIAVLVCMAIATTILLGIVQSSLRLQRQMRHEMQMEQTRWILDAGISQASKQLNSEPDYRGGMLRIEPGLSHFSEPSIEVVILPSQTKVGKIQARITARLQGLGKYAPVTQRSKTIEFNKPTTE